MRITQNQWRNKNLCFNSLLIYPLIIIIIIIIIIFIRLQLVRTFPLQDMKSVGTNNK